MRLLCLFQWLCLLWVASASVACGDDDAGSAGDASTMDSGGSGGSGAIDGGGSGGTGGSGGADDDAATSDLDANVADARVVADANHADASMCQPPLSALHDSMGGSHVASNAGVTYNSNPPSSGPHCGSWGRYAIYGDGKPLPRCNYIHNLEHGGVVLLYKCDGPCPEVVAALSAVRDRILDEQCLPAKRVIITPDADLDTPVAATAWQNTWTSECVNEAAMTSLEDFIHDNLGSAGLAPESGVCSDGSVTP